MATTQTVNQEKKELLDLLLKKTNLTKKDVVDEAISRFIATRIDMITPAERKQFKHLVF